MSLRHTADIINLKVILVTYKFICQTVFIQKVKNKKSISFSIYERVNKERVCVGYLASIKYEELDYELPLENFWDKVYSKFEQNNIPKSEWHKLVNAIAREVPAIEFSQ